MKWAKERDVLLGKEVMLFELWKYKLVSRETGNCLDQIAESLNSYKSHSSMCHKSRSETD